MGIQTSTINSGPVSGFKNRIINGNFDFWQRGTSFTGTPTTGTYCADRWIFASDGSGATRTISQQTFAVGQSDVPNNPTYFLKYNQTVAGTAATYTQLAQRIEDVRTFAGQQVTVSFWVKAAASITLPSINFAQVFGTGGSPSSAVFTTIATNVSVGTSWARVTVTGTLPSISGKTIGTNGDSNLTLQIGLPINTTFNCDFAQVQVEQGPVATAFESRDAGTEFAMCQRYFVYISPGLSGSNNITISTTYNQSVYGYSFWNVPVSATMRATPSINTISNYFLGSSGGASTLTSLAVGRNFPGMVTLASESVPMNSMLYSSAGLSISAEL